MARLLRSASLLAAVHFLRFGFAIGVLHVSLTRSTALLLVHDYNHCSFSIILRAAAHLVSEAQQKWHIHMTVKGSTW